MPFFLAAFSSFLIWSGGRKIVVRFISRVYIQCIRCQAQSWGFRNDLANKTNVEQFRRRAELAYRGPQSVYPIGRSKRKYFSQVYGPLFDRGRLCWVRTPPGRPSTFESYTWHH